MSFFQSGGECLKAHVSVGPDQIFHFTDTEGKSGLWYMVQVPGHLNHVPQYGFPLSVGKVSNLIWCY
jgi:hypothetical protein